jgi:hypothetical protein
MKVCEQQVSRIRSTSSTWISVPPELYAKAPLNRTVCHIFAKDESFG